MIHGNDEEPRLELLQAERAKALRDLQHACDRRHRGRLEQVLADLDDRIRALGSAGAIEEKR